MAARLLGQEARHGDQAEREASGKHAGQFNIGPEYNLVTMEVPPATSLTLLLKRWSDGDRAALDEITPIVYRELRLLADGYLRRERSGHTLQPTELIHEAYLRLVDQRQKFESRRQFYGVAAHLMRMILVDHARSKGRVKRGSGAEKVALDDVILFAPERGEDLLAIDEALERLAAFDERKSKAVELRFFGGMSLEEVAESLGVSVPTVVRELRLAETWLYRELAGA
jgi:RNA polymerase sigma factor (TIGR02999 family)